MAWGKSKKVNFEQSIHLDFFNASPDALLVLSSDGRYIECNQAAIKMFRHTNKNDMLNVTPDALSPQFQPDGQSSENKAKALIDELIKKGHHRFEWTHRRADGNEFPVLVTLSLHEIESKKIIYTFIMDISEMSERANRAQALHALTAKFDKSVSSVLETVAGASTELEATAASMSASAEQTTQQAATVASATEQASGAVQTVASAAEELSASIREIGRQVAESSTIANASSEEAGKANLTVKELSDTASRIGDVIKLINDIASQTNLLALNATIEAARAGEAGKGFAVVANEVKNLANQTARATDEISQQINTVQTQTRNAVEAIGHIVERIQEISHISTTVASAVEEQSAATSQIAMSVTQAAQGTQHIAFNISGVNEAASATGAASHQVLSSAQSLSSEAEHLRNIVVTFLHDVRAA